MLRARPLIVRCEVCAAAPEQAGETIQHAFLKHFETLRPSHGGAALGGCWVWRVRRLGLVAVAPARHHLRAQVAVRGKNTVKSGEVHSGLGHQGGQPGDEIQWPKEEMRGAVPVRGLELELHLNLRLNPVFRNMPGLSAPGRQSGHDLRIQT